MHNNSMRLMEYFRDKYLVDMKGCSVLDVGAMLQVGAGAQRTYRELFEEDYLYAGMDLESGPNVDIVGYTSLLPHSFDVIISGQTMEHVCRPWQWLQNLSYYFKEYICIIAPNTWEEHRFPIDTYRYFPDGMRDLFDYAGIKEVEIFKSNKDTVGIGSHG